MAQIKKLNSEKLVTMIGEGTEITGDIHFTGGLHIAGVVNGNVSDDSEGHAVLTMSSSGKIRGNVDVTSMVLDGSITGNIRSTEVIQLTTEARLNGRISYSCMEIALGAQVNGGLDCNDEGEKD